MRFALLIAALVAATVGFAGAAHAAVPKAPAGSIDVFPGDSIQAAINSASPGDTIVVHPGVYHESLLIKKDGIKLWGSGASSKGTVLEPSGQTTTRCMRGGSGICVFGSKSGPVTGVRVKGFLVKGFPVFGFVAFGAANTWVSHSTFVNNGEYGASSFHSTGTHLLFNETRGSEEAGLYIGDAQNSGTVIRGNETRGNNSGILLRDSTGGLVTDNNIHGNCAGIVNVDTGSPGPAGDFRIWDNAVHQNNRFCKGEKNGPPPFSGTGIALIGATGDSVTNNDVWANKPSKAGSAFPGGIVLASAKTLGGGVETNNKVNSNQAFDNRSVDISWDQKGHNTFKKNKCDFSDPGGLCH